MTRSVVSAISASREVVPEKNLPLQQSGSEPAPIVLCNASYYGTLAAVRAMGRAGVPVVTVDPAVFAPGRYSRYASLHLSSPPFESDEWPDWLLELGRRGPRRAIYATSDAVSFALAEHREQLGAVFDLYQPELETMMSILDKGLLIEHARAVGIDCPETWFPRSSADVAAIASEFGGKFVAKPRSQLAVRTGTKGALIDAAVSDGVAEYEVLLRQGEDRSRFARRYRELTMPMLQRYHPEALQKVYSLSGFRDRSGAHIVMRAAQKIMQRPRQLGVGLCFEEADIDPELASRTILLCERIGYYGAFELEFILSGGRPLLIDFNGRLYNQLAFDIARGMDLPRMVYAGATGQREKLARLVSDVPERERGGALIFCNRLGLSLTVAAQRAFGRMSTEDASRWREWRRRANGRLVDAVHDADDPVPAYADAVQQVLHAARHPRAFVRQMSSSVGQLATASLVATTSLVASAT
ncbi:MAG: hypothetical protein NW223_21855 [Hyphomicrobiaceae bacterium]|nr:hypothetical protein [Hyphomicrobiaceae bacterium]